MKLKSVAANFTRPADTTAYTAGDLVANSVTAGSVVPLIFSYANFRTQEISIRNARLRKSNTTVVLAQFVVHLFDGTVPLTVTNGDNGAYLVSSSVRGFLGTAAFDLTSGAEIGSDGAIKGLLSGTFGGANLPAVNLGNIGLQALLVASAAYVPASAEVFELFIDAEQY